MKNKIYATGDIHGPLSIHKLNTENFPEGKTLTKDDYVIIAGDFGLIWGGKFQKENDWWLAWLDERPWTTLFVDGNHENHEMLARLETVQMFGSDVGKVNDSVFHLRRGRIYEINGERILTIGGAESIDKAYRIEGSSWWVGELLSKAEEDKILKDLEDVSEVDYVITHTCPRDVFKLLSLNHWKSMDPTMKFLDFISNKLKFKHWYFGHFHLEQTIKNFTCLYHDIVKIK